MVELLHGRRRTVLAAAGVAAALLLVARWAADAGAPARRPLPVAPVRPPAAAPARAAPLVVDVVGAVRRPGLYRLPAGSRVADALTRAGGATRRADTALVNLAAPLADGVQLVVPRRGEPAPAAAASGAATGGAGAGPVHLNTATEQDLDTLPGIGPVTAAKIVAFRERHGPFSSLDDLDAIPGIGPARIEQLQGLAEP